MRSCSCATSSYLSPSARCTPVNDLAGLLRFYHREAASLCAYDDETPGLVEIRL